MFDFDDLEEAEVEEKVDESLALSPTTSIEVRRVTGPGSGYRHRWAVNIKDWNPTGGETGPEFQFLLRLIREEADRVSVMRPRQYDDKKRALLSRLLIRQASASALDHGTFEHLTIKRTKGRKPFLSSPLPPEAEAPNWNANVSHEGSWVLCASEPHCVTGVDVAELRRTKPNGQEIDFYKSFEQSLTKHEWSEVRKSCKTLDGQYEMFSRYWSAKEAFTKARGDGLGFDFSKAQFHWTPLPGFPEGTAYEGDVHVEGDHHPLWRFVQHKMPTPGDDKPHWVTVGRGPMTDIVDAWGEFSKTLRRPQDDFEDHEWDAVLKEESPHFDVIPVSFLIPPDAIEEYNDVVGKSA